METVRSIFTVISVITFLGVVFWAFGAPGKRSALSANADLLGDDDRAHFRLPKNPR
jgi:cbb3-type cytochrome oxidase subunit 3